MKKMHLRILAAVLAVLLLVPTLAGCGKKKENDPANPDTPDFVYVPTYIEMSGDVQDMSNVSISGEKLYFTSWVMTDEETGEGSYRIYSVNMDGTGLAQLENYAPPEKSAELAAIENLQGSVYINYMCVDSEGKLWVAENASYYYYDLPADFDENTDNMWAYYTEADNSMTLRRLDETGAELLNVDLTSLTQNADSEMGGFYINSMQVDDAGNIYIASGQSVYLLGTAGKVQGEIKADNWINNLLRLSDGTVAVTGYMDNGFALKRIDLATKSFGEDIALPYNVYEVYPGGGEYLCTMGDGNNLYGLRADTQESEKLINWINCDISGDSLGNITVLPDGRIFCTSYNWQESGAQYEMVLLTKQDASSMPEKTVLTMATLYLDYNLRNAIIEFNKSNDKYRIQVNDYSEYNTEDDYTAGLTKLSTEIISGTVPDLLDVTSLPVKQYAAKGLLEDLYPYIDNDPELSREDFFKSVFSALEMDGKLYQASASFSVTTVAGNPDVVGAEPGWTMDEFMAVIQQNPQADAPIGQYFTKNDFLYYAMVMGMDQYVDWSTGKCSFDQGEFAKVLEFANTFPEEYNYDEDNYISEFELIQSGRQLLSNVNISDFQNTQLYQGMFGGKLVFKGFPNAQRVSAVASLDNGLAMSTKCKDKDGAWSFIRRLLTQEWQESGNIWAFPTNVNAYNTLLEKAMTPEYTTDEDGNQVEISQGSWGMDDFSVDIHATTQEEADMLQALIDAVGGTMSYDEKMMNIIQENAAAFFAGQKSAQETAAIIQNRISIYVAEQS